MSFLALRDVGKRFGDIQALRSVDLEVGADELVVVLGPTGAGKTTLLRTIAGLELPETGTIFMGEREITALEPAERDVALVFQNFSLYPQWTVRRNLEFPLRAPGRGMTESEIRQRVVSVAELLQITALLDRDSTKLSGGEMQRVAIGRAIVRRPRIFLMDEPLSNLDAKLREALRVELVALRRKLQTPMLFVTHDQAEALSMGDRIVVLSEGRILQSGTPEEIYRKPVSPTVALQLGQPAINLLRVRRSEKNWVTEGGVPVMPASGGGEAEMILGIRPEDIETRAGGSEGTVKVVEEMGPTRTLLVEWAKEEIHIITPKGTPVRPGDSIAVRINPDRAILWPRDERSAVSGQR